jgi:hypothetical protein
MKMNERNGKKIEGLMHEACHNRYKKVKKKKGKGGREACASIFDRWLLWSHLFRVLLQYVLPSAA